MIWENCAEGLVMLLIWELLAELVECTAVVLDSYVEVDLSQRGADVER